MSKKCGSVKQVEKMPQIFSSVCKTKKRKTKRHKKKR